MERRVVVTGLGMVSPLGLDVSSTWQALIRGESGAGPITAFDTSAFDVKIACEVKGFDPQHYFEVKDARRMDRFTQFAVVAAQEAIKQSALEVNSANENDIGVVIGNNKGGIITLCNQIDILKEKGPRRVSPFLVPMMMVNRAAAEIAIKLGLKGCNFCTSSACASGATAIGEAFHIIKRGDAQVMLAGGVEASIVPVVIAGFGNMKALSTRNTEPGKASRPFDAERDGFVVGEGGAVLVLEERDFALQRGARILAELAGYGSSADAFHISEPAEGGEGLARAITQALGWAKLPPEAVDYINAHGTGTPLGDKKETAAIKRAFGKHAYKLAVSSTKSETGHLISGAGALASVFCVMTIKENIIPPTINQEHPDPECDLDYVPNMARKANVNVALANSLGFGGHNTALIFTKHE